MLEPPTLELPIVHADELEDSARACLKPGEQVEDAFGVARRLPTYYYRVPSWKAALNIELAPNFGLWELIDVDVREAEAMRSFPRYVPCAITLLASQLQLLRQAVGRVVRIAANGGYRSPAHQLSRTPTPHVWGTAANIYRIGDDLLDSRDKVEKYAQIARSAMPGAWIRRWGVRPGHAFDHLHIDIGYVVAEPHPAEATPAGLEDGNRGGLE